MTRAGAGRRPPFAGSGPAAGRAATPPASDRLRITVRVRPGAAHDRAGGERDGALLVSVRPPAVDGRATEAALRVIAEAFGVRPRAVRLVSGATSRTKVVEIEGDPLALGDRLTGLRTGDGSPPRG